MKNIRFFATALLFLATLFYSGRLSAQWSQNSAYIWTTANKNVGIGTTTPTNAKLQFGNLTGNKITLYDDGISGAYGFGINSTNLCAYVPSDYGRFSVRTNAYDGVEKFYVGSNGSVGLGSRIYPGSSGTEGGYSLVHFKNGTSTAGGIIRASIGNSDPGDAPLELQSSGLIIANSGFRRVIVTGGGNVGIGTTAPFYRLEVNGSAAKPGGGSWATLSDRRLKGNIRPYTDGLQTLLKIKPVTFHYNEKSGYETAPEYVGVIAQDLQASGPLYGGRDPRQGGSRD